MDHFSTPSENLQDRQLLKTEFPFVLILSTFPSKKLASEIVMNLLNDRLIACANLFPSLSSFYWWNDRIEQSDEVLGMMKTNREKIPLLIEKIKELHPYEVPEVLVVPIETGNQPYLAWLQQELVKPSVL